MQRLAEVINQYDLINQGKIDEDIENTYQVSIISRLNSLINELLDMATVYGFDHNLWHNYLTYLLISMENPFSITCEKIGPREGSVNLLAKADFKIFKALFDYDFSNLEEELGINCFSIISNYKAVKKSKGMYNKNVSDKVIFLSNRISSANDEEEIFNIVTGFYKDYGGKFGLIRLLDCLMDGKQALFQLLIPGGDFLTW